MTGTLGAESTPQPFDVIVDGHGYRLLDSLESHPFGTHRASYGLSPTFVPRTNIQGDYGDSFQDFWMTFTQRDWSLGEGQRHFKSGDDESQRRYWASTGIDPLTPGQVTLRQADKVITPAAAPLAFCLGIRGSASAAPLVYVTSSNLYTLDAYGAVVSKGAHGATATIYGGIASDGTDIYICGNSGATPIRKWDGTTFSTFSTQTGIEKIAYLNNALYGFSRSTATLYVFDSAGVATALYQWKGADGAALIQETLAVYLVPFGGDLLIGFSDVPTEPTIWLYDGTGVAKLWQMPHNFTMGSFCVANGVIFAVGGFFKPASNGTSYMVRTALLYLANGQEGIAWQSTAESAYGSLTPIGQVVPWAGGVAFWELDTLVKYYDLPTGNVSYLFNPTASFASSAPFRLNSSQASLVAWGDSTASFSLWPDYANLVTSAYITTSLFDGDNSLTKRFKSIIVDGELNGGTIDIAYQADSLDGAFTTLQTGATPGTEYALPTVVTGRSICVKVTLNRASATAGPTLRRIKVRAAPMLDSFERREYILDLSGRDGQSHILLRDDTQHSKDGHEMAVDLMTAAASTVPITIYDRFGTFTGIVDTDGFTLVEIRPEQYVAMVRVREV